VRIEIRTNGNASMRMKARRDGSVRMTDAEPLFAALPFMWFSDSGGASPRI
jgi:hypothetical protein